MFRFLKSNRRSAIAAKKTTGRVRLGVETLEDRLVQSVTAGPVMTPAISTITPQYSIPAITPYTAIEMRHAYGFDNLPLGASGAQLTGAGQTIAIVVAFDVFDEFQNGDLRLPLPNMQADLHTFDVENHLPDVQITPVFKILPALAPASWAVEAALDVQWAHAIAPGAQIDLVEAQSDSRQDLMNAVDLARQQPGVTVVSMSWGGPETSDESRFDSVLTTFPGHVPTTFVAASGDHGTLAYDNNGNLTSSYAMLYPAASPSVVSVGGTRLNLNLVDTGSVYVSESAWSVEAQTFIDPSTGQPTNMTEYWSSGGGFSQFESAPSFQTGLTGSGLRTIPDVAYNGDIATGVEVYRSDQKGWMSAAGTSAGTPQWAGLFALANQARAVRALPALGHALQDIYTQSCNDFHDITSGNNGMFSAISGYDPITGRGTPIANLLIPDLIAVEKPTIQSPIYHLTTSVLTTSVLSTSGTSYTATATPTLLVQSSGANPVGTVATTTVATTIATHLSTTDQASKTVLVTFHQAARRDDLLFETASLWVFPSHLSCFDMLR